MDSEKVKEIKDKLQEEIFIATRLDDKLRRVETKDLQDTLTLINELESENERLRVVFDIANERTYRKKFNDEWRKEYQKELDKQGNGHIAGCPDFDLVYKLYFEQKDRIAELKDKIEDGTLVELPCKVGDTVYFIEYFCNANGCSNDKQTICCGCSEMLERERKNQAYVISEKKFRLKDLSKINKTLYITKEAAEARLKELQVKQDND